MARVISESMAQVASYPNTAPLTWTLKGLNRQHNVHSLHEKLSAILGPDSYIMLYLPFCSARRYWRCCKYCFVTFVDGAHAERAVAMLTDPSLSSITSGVGLQLTMRPSDTQGIQSCLSRSSLDERALLLFYRGVQVDRDTALLHYCGMSECNKAAGPSSLSGGSAWQASVVQQPSMSLAGLIVQHGVPRNMILSF